MIKGMVFDPIKSVRHMASSEEVLDDLRQVLIQGEGDYFSWCGEQITIGDGCVITDTHETKLGQFYALDLIGLLDKAQEGFSQDVAVYQQMCVLNEKFVHANALHDVSHKSFLSAIGSSSLNTFFSEFDRAIEHALVSPSTHYTSISSLLLEGLNTECDTPELNVVNNIKSIATEFLNNYTTDGANASHFAQYGRDFVRFFCNKKDFKMNVKTVFSNIEYFQGTMSEFSAMTRFKESQKAFSIALRHQGLTEQAGVIESLVPKVMVNWGVGVSDDLCAGMCLTRRKYCFELTLSHDVAQQLQIFLLKYNREDILKYAA